MPGIGVKRWLGVTALGVVLVGIGALLALEFLSTFPRFATLADWITFQYLTVWQRGLLVALLGLCLLFLGVVQLYGLTSTHILPSLRQPENRAMLETLLRRQQRSTGPKIVAIGGGTGMPQLLRGLRQYTDNITAIVTVADDGGSSGRLRQSLGTLPPGDFRNNIAALSDAENLMKRLFQYRFPDSNPADPDTPNELAGHSFGNLFISTMAAVTGSFEAGIAESSKVLRVPGRVLPSTLENVVLGAEVRRPRPDGGEDWVNVEGESQLPKAGGRVERVYLKPEHVRAYPEAIRAILQADLIVAGPGSFFTSILPNLLVDGVREAICAAAAPRIYICNVVTQPGETDDYTVSDHMRKLREQAGDAFTTVLANDNYDIYCPPSPTTQWVTLPDPGETIDYTLHVGDVVD
ncbi:MAG: YvcK family protein, partial [Caldilineaceae bacterium]|nr:YvcK family protein [Caldilineaceae bacterium]